MTQLVISLNIHLLEDIKSTAIRYIKIKYTTTEIWHLNQYIPLGRPRINAVEDYSAGPEIREPLPELSNDAAQNRPLWRAWSMSCATPLLAVHGWKEEETNTINFRVVQMLLNDIWIGNRMALKWKSQKYHSNPYTSNTMNINNRKRRMS